MKEAFKPGVKIQCHLANNAPGFIKEYQQEGFYVVNTEAGDPYIVHEDDMSVWDPCQVCEHGQADIATRRELELSGALLLEELLPWADMLKQVRSNSADLLLNNARWRGTRVQNVLSSDGETEYSIYHYQNAFYCTCPDFIHRNIQAGNRSHECKHIIKMKDELEAGHADRKRIWASKMKKRNGHQDAVVFIHSLRENLIPHNNRPRLRDEVADGLAERLLDTIEAYVKEPS